MRAELNAVLGDLAVELPELMAVSADGKIIFSDFISHAGRRHVDVGIAESTLVGVAAGIARCGHPVVVSSIASFLLRRAYEQIVIDICCDALPVKFIGIGGGLAYGTLGPTHHILEDVALMRMHDVMSIYVPCDALGAGEALRTVIRQPGPAYIRIGSGDDPALVQSPEKSSVQPRILRDGSDLVVLAIGICVHEALASAAILEEDGVSVRVVEVACLHPWPQEQVRELLLGNRPVLTVEEHYREGGLGSSVAELLRRDPSRRFERLAVDHRPAPTATREDLLAFYNLDRTGIARCMRGLVT
jgi:transketolase